ncbi:MAG: TldD/PmbA family protein [Actinomycetota bacterium]|nr:TldD/PmbA family protein [Actinomycetota bacterium]
MTGDKSGLLDEESAAEAAAPALDIRGADGVEVVLLASDTGVTRYAASQIIQNISRRELRAYVRVVVGDRNATVTTNQLDPDSMKKAAARALEAASASRSDPLWQGLPRPDDVGTPRALLRWDEETSEASPADRAAVVKTVVGIAGDDAAGFHETSSHAYGIFNSAGIRCFDAHTRAVLTCLSNREGATGWGEHASFRRGDIEAEGTGRRALEKAMAGAGVGAADAGVYEVVLEPSAVAEMLDYLSYVGFGAKQVIEAESFLASSTGKRVAHTDVTVADDAAHPLSIGIGFDFEGVPKRRVAVIDGGIATGPVTDRRTSKELDLEVTGHASGSNEYGPIAANVVMEPGRASAEELVGGVDEGLLVTRFHYVNVLDRPSTLLTGMTRDGTFRIRRGEIAEPVRNLRFSQSVLEALGEVLDIGRDQQSFAPEWGSFGSTVAPSLRIGAFRFSSTTTH